MRRDCRFEMLLQVLRERPRFTMGCILIGLGVLAQSACAPDNAVMQQNLNNEQQLFQEP